MHSPGDDADDDADNDYLREYRARRDGWRLSGAYHDWLRKPGGPPAYDHRMACVRRYAFAVPNAAALAAIGRHAPIVELGAGNGYWAYLLRRRGVDVVAYDVAPPGLTRNPYKFEPRTWTEVTRGGVEVLARHADRALFLCWPGYRDAFAESALAAYRGRLLAYVGEGRGGHTADDAFFARLERDWDELERVDIPQWPGVHDCLVVFRRRSLPCRRPPTEGRREPTGHGVSWGDATGSQGPVLQSGALAAYPAVALPVRVPRMSARNLPGQQRAARPSMGFSVWRTVLERPPLSPPPKESAVAMPLGRRNRSAPPRAYR